MRQKAIIGALVGLTLGCLVGALTEFRQPAGPESKSYLESLNQDTGKPQLHVKGKPELK